MEAPLLLCLPSEMRNTFGRKSCLLAVALGTSGVGWKGSNGLCSLPGPGLWSGPPRGGQQWGGGRLPSLQGALLSGWLGAPRRHRTAGMGWLVGGHSRAVLPPKRGMYIVFVGVHRSTTLPAMGHAVCMAAGGQTAGILLLPSSAWYQALSLLTGLLTFSSL